MIVSGKLPIVHTETYHTIVSRPEVSKQIIKRNTQLINPFLGRKPTAEEVAGDIELLGGMPPQVQGYIEDGSDVIYMNLKEDFLVSTHWELLMKHGAQIEGEWSAVGLKDASPSNEHMAFTLEALEEAKRERPGFQLLYDSMHIAGVLRCMIGRPAGCHGITPLVIFREVGG